MGIKDIVFGFSILSLASVSAVCCYRKRKVEKELTNHTRFDDSFRTLVKWMENKNAGKSMADVFLDYGYSKIAIYGAGDVGRLLLEELKNTDISVTCFIDNNAEALQKINETPVVSINEFKSNPLGEVVIVTPIADYNAINKTLISSGITLPTISLKDIMFEI